MPTLGDAVSRLRRYNEATPLPSQEAMERAEEAAFARLQEQERAAEESRCPSLRSIPRFHERRAKPADESNSLRLKVQQEARNQLLYRKTREELLDESDLHAILNLLREHSHHRDGDGSNPVELIDYQAFACIREELRKRGERFEKFFLPSVFLKFPRDRFGYIAIVPFFTFVVRKVNLKQTRMQLSHYDYIGLGYLREKDMENFIFELIPTLPQLNSLQEEFYPFYVFTAVRRFFFFLDPKRTGKIYISQLLTSLIIQELYELRQEQPLGAQEAESNWFSVQSALKVYGAYLELDIDQNGMLSKAELMNYGSGGGGLMLTDVFIERVFEEYHTYRDSETGEREMDYKTFLDFVLAMDHKNSSQGIHYFWKLIDINHNGIIDSFVISYFFRAIVNQLETKKIDVASVDDVKDEIFDMVHAKHVGAITLQDLLNCRQGGTVLSMLIDAAAFWRYDHRESLLMEPADDEGAL